MLDMKTKAALLALSAGAAAIIVACSGGEDPDPSVSPGASSSGSTSAPTSGVPVGPTGSAVNPVNPVSPSNSTTAGPTGASTTGGTGTSTGTTSEACDPAPATPKDITLGGVYDYGDSKTTRSFTQPMPNVLCLEGTAYPSASEDGENDYAYWGAGVGLQLAPGAGTTPYDATMDKIAGVTFDITDWAERPVRVQMSQVDDPAITDASTNFQENGFVYGGSSPKSTKANATLTIMFEDFKLPSWTLIPEANQGPLDGSKLHSLQIQIASEPKDLEANYKFCITNLKWLDACEQVVGTTTLPAPEGDSSNSTGDTGSGASDSTSGVSDSTSGTDTGSAATDSTSGGSDSTSGADLLDYAADISPIFQEKCAGCHAGSWYGDGTMEPNAELKGKIKERVESTDAGFMMPRGGSLDPDELEAIVAWTQQ